MSVQDILNRPTSTADARRLHVAVNRTVGMPAALAVVQIILAYEWLVSGINKLLNPNFTAQLADTLRQSMNGNPYGLYVHLLRNIVLPNASLFGMLTELVETAIGVALLVGAALWIWRPAARITQQAALVACAALAGAAFLSLNYFLQGGSPLPWVNPANVFSEGVDIDILIPMLALALLVANVRAVKAARTHADTQRPFIQRRGPWAA